MSQPNCQSIRYCWEADKVKTLIRLRAELSPLFTGKRNASKYAWAVVERELSVPLPISKIIKKWNNLLQEYKAIKLSEEPKRREWPFFNLMDVYFSDQVNDPSLRLFSSTKRFDTDTFDDKNFDEELQAVIAAANLNSSMSQVLTNLGLGLGMRGNRLETTPKGVPSNMVDISNIMEDSHPMHKKIREEPEHKPEISLNLSVNNNDRSSSDRNNNSKNHHLSLNQSTNHNEKESAPEPNNNSQQNNNNLISSSNFSVNNENSVHSSINNGSNHNEDEYEDSMVRAYERNLKNLNQKFLHEMNEHHNIDQYLLSWRGFHGNMCKGFHNLQRDGQMVDVTIAAGGKIFKAHKLVLSVCSPYFQKIFLEHPSTHPILFMTDVNSNHMAGLLDFMYSGQVNVKYEDLPNFLKVAEALQVKGLHGESTGDNEDKGADREREETSYATQYRQQQQHQHHLQQQQFNYRQSTPTYQPPAPESLRNHIKPKTSLIPSDLANNNNNNVNMNNNNMNSNHKSPAKFGVQQVNSSSKMLDNQKYQKYYSKRKLLAQYENEMRQEKRNRTGNGNDYETLSDNGRNLSMHHRSQSQDEDSRMDNGNCVGLNLIQNIKEEDENGEDGNTNDNSVGFYATHLGKINHSILEPNIVLKHSDEVLSTSSSASTTASHTSRMSEKMVS